MVNEVERRLLVLIARFGCRHTVFDSPPQYHYTPRTTPFATLKHLLLPNQNRKKSLLLIVEYVR